jgi:hypothetical protein
MPTVLRFIEPCAYRHMQIARRPAPTGFMRLSTTAIALWRGEIPSASGSSPGAAMTVWTGSRSWSKP